MGGGEGWGIVGITYGIDIGVDSLISS